MNLATDPWIPIGDLRGSIRRVSLVQAFAEGDQLQDLVVRPHERVALMRLLIGIAQAALDGPADSEDLEARQKHLPMAARIYLAHWHDSFELFHPKKPFLQFAGLARPPKPAKSAKKTVDAADASEEEEFTPATKLDFALATGNNATLFDHLAASDQPRSFTPADLALMLITFQCFSPGGRIGVARWRGVATHGNGSSGHAPCSPSAMLHACIRRGCLIDTIRSNLLSRRSVEKNYRQPWGRPVWELMPQSFEDAPAVENATQSYLGRLMPLARAILLRSTGMDLLLANGLDYPTGPVEFPAEPTASVARKRDGSGYAFVGAGNKALWRELPAIVVKRMAGAAGGPLILDELDGNASFDLWVGALATDKASILDTVEGVYSIPPRMLNDAGRRTYEEEVKESERIAYKLGEACKVYRQNLEIKPQGYPEQSVAQRFYWNVVEQRRPSLHKYLDAPDGTEEAGSALGFWRSNLRAAARDAFIAGCPNETPRQLRAHALGLRALYRGLQKPAETLSEKLETAGKD